MQRTVGSMILIALLALPGCRGRETRAEATAAGAGQVPQAVPAPAAGEETGLPGTYVVELPAADAMGRRVSLDIRPDSSCVLKTEYLGKGERVESGVWSRDGELIRLVIGPPRDPSKQKRFAFTAGGDSLVGAEWDTAAYGALGLGTLRRR